MKTRGCFLVAVVITLMACGGGSGEPVVESPIFDGATSQNFSAVNYTGPVATTEDIQRFKVNVWDNLVAGNRCGQCHTDAGQPPVFVRTDDVNLAYIEANSIVNLARPADSLMVTKVAGGHNCWESDPNVCADILTRWITAWGADSVMTSSTEIELTAPVIRTPGDSKNFPTESSGFSTTIYPLLTQYCSECHTEEADQPQSPFMASTDVDVAYQGAISKINLDNPTQSRLYIRLEAESHRCWSDCASNASEMLAAITSFADDIPLSAIDPNWLTSKSLRLGDGIVASQGGRFEPNLIALYEFKPPETESGPDNIAYDTSGVEPALNLTFSGQVEWVAGWGIRIIDGKAQGTTFASKKLHDLIKSTGEYSIEAWVVPANVTQEEAVIVGYVGGADARNFTLGQTLYNYDVLNRASTTNANGAPALSSPDADEVLQATLQHVTVTYDSFNGRRLFVNGELIEVTDTEGPGSLAAWDDTFALVVGNEAANNGLWQGTMRMLAIHNRAMTLEQVQQNFEVGVGQKFYLLFQVSDYVDIPDSYVVFEVSQFDNYSYLFNAPFFVTLADTAIITDNPIKSIRIGMNGQEVKIGQAFSTIDTSLTASAYVDGRQTLSTLGTIIGSEKGVDLDEFFLTFEQIGSSNFVRTDTATLLSIESPDRDPASHIGLRHFEEINATFSKLTGVSTQQGKNQSDGVYNTFVQIQQQLPAEENIQGFLASHQMAVTQLAISYCDALVDDTSLRDAFFVNFTQSRLTQGTSTALDSTGRTLLIQDLLNNLVGSGLSSQPSESDVSNEVDSLIVNLTSSCSNCNNANRTQVIAKASCAAVLGSAVSLLQ